MIYAVTKNENEVFFNSAGIIGLSPSSIPGTESMMNSLLYRFSNYSNALSFYTKPKSLFILGYYNNSIPSKYTNKLLHIEEDI
jgi:hypothetical protein